MSRQWQIRPYVSNPLLLSVQVGSVLFIPGHDGIEKLRCNFAGTFCDWDCYLHTAGYRHPAVVIELHRHHPEVDDHRMLPVTFIQMTSSLQSHFVTFPVQWFKNAKGKKSALLLPHTYTLPLYRFRPFFNDPSSISIKCPDPSLFKGLWLHCDVESKAWSELNAIMQVIRDGNDIFQTSSYPSNQIGTEIVTKLQKKSRNIYTSRVSDNWNQVREQQNNARTEGPDRTEDFRILFRPTKAVGKMISSHISSMQNQQRRKQIGNPHPPSRTIPENSTTKKHAPPCKNFATSNMFDLLGNNEEEDTLPSTASEDSNDAYPDGLTERDLYDDSEEE